MWAEGTRTPKKEIQKCWPQSTKWCFARSNGRFEDIKENLIGGCRLKMVVQFARSAALGLLEATVPFERIRAPDVFFSITL
jgi:hypothetical protein